MRIQIETSTYLSSESADKLQRFLEPTADKKQSLHPAVTGRYHLDDRDLSGVEVILALSFDMNVSLRGLVE